MAYPGGNPGGVPNESSPPSGGGQTASGSPISPGNGGGGGGNPPAGGGVAYPGGSPGGVPQQAAPGNATQNPGNGTGHGALKGLNDFVNNIANKMQPPPSYGTGQPYTGPLAINGHSPLYYANEAINNLAGGGNGLQQASQAATQFANQNFRDQWTQPMSPAQATTQVAGAFGGAVLGKGLGAGAGALRQALANKSGLANAVGKSLSAGIQAGKEEAQNFSGFGSPANGANATGGNPGGNSQVPANGIPESGGAPPGENPLQPASAGEPPPSTSPPPGSSPTTLNGAVQQMADEFSSDFGTSAPSEAGSPESSAGPLGSDTQSPCLGNNACFPTAVRQAQLWKDMEDLGTLPPGTRINGAIASNPNNTNMMMNSRQIQQQLRQVFGGTAAANNPVYTPAERLAQQQGIPIPVSPTRLSQILNSGQDGNQWLIFIKPTVNGPGHVFNARTVNGATQMWDATQRMDGSMWFSAPLQQVFAYQLF